MDQDPIRWIVVGAGTIGRRHLRNLVAIGERDVVAVRRRAAPLDRDLASVPVFATLAEARGQGAAIAVICTPTACHPADAIRAVRAGCHVLIEKPLGWDLAGVPELRDEIASRGVRVGIAHCLRYHPVIAELRRQISNRTLGAPRHAAIWCGSDLASWRPGRDARETYSASTELGGGALLDLSHELDYLRVLLGEVATVTAHLDHRGALGIETEDNADLMLDFAGGARATCHLDYLARPPIRGGILLCDTGAYQWDLLTPRLEQKREGSDRWAGLQLLDDRGWDQMYVEELRSFRRSLDRPDDWEEGLAAGVRVLEIVGAARLSSATGARVAVSHG